MRRYYSKAELAHLLGITPQSVNDRLRTGSVKETTNPKKPRGRKVIDIADNQLFPLLKEKMGLQAALEIRADWPVPGYTYEEAGAEEAGYVEEGESSGPMMDLDDITIPRDIRKCSKVDIEKIRLYYQALTQQVKGQEARGDLIERTRVSRFFREVLDIHQTQLGTLPRRVAPSVCAALEITDPSKINTAVKEMEAGVYKILSSIQKALEDAI